jgi:hypothetical protein
LEGLIQKEGGKKSLLAMIKDFKVVLTFKALPKSKPLESSILLPETSLC